MGPFNAIRTTGSRSSLPLMRQKGKQLGQSAGLFTAKRTDGNRFGNRADQAGAESVVLATAGSGDFSKKQLQATDCRRRLCELLKGSAKSRSVCCYAAANCSWPSASSATTMMPCRSANSMHLRLIDEDRLARFDRQELAYRGGHCFQSSRPIVGTSSACLAAAWRP